MKEERHLDSDEFIDVMFLTMDEIEALIKEDKVVDSKLFTALTLYRTKML